MIKNLCSIFFFNHPMFSRHTRGCGESAPPSSQDTLHQLNRARRSKAFGSTTTKFKTTVLTSWWSTILDKHLHMDVNQQSHFRAFTTSLHLPLRLPIATSSEGHRHKIHNKICSVYTHKNYPDDNSLAWSETHLKLLPYVPSKLREAADNIVRPNATLANRSCRTQHLTTTARRRICLARQGP